MWIARWHAAERFQLRRTSDCTVPWSGYLDYVRIRYRLFGACQLYFRASSSVERRVNFISFLVSVVIFSPIFAAIPVRSFSFYNVSASWKLFCKSEYVCSLRSLQPPLHVFPPYPPLSSPPVTFCRGTRWACLLSSRHHLQFLLWLWRPQPISGSRETAIRPFGRRTLGRSRLVFLCTDQRRWFGLEGMSAWISMSYEWLTDAHMLVINTWGLINCLEGAKL